MRDCVSSRLVCNFVAVCLSVVQFILQLKLCLYTIMHLSLEEFKICLKSSLSTQLVRHTVRPGAGVGVAVPQKTRTAHPWFLRVN